MCNLNLLRRRALIAEAVVDVNGHAVLARRRTISAGSRRKVVDLLASEEDSLARTDRGSRTPTAELRASC